MFVAGDCMATMMSEKQTNVLFKKHKDCPGFKNLERNGVNF